MSKIKTATVLRNKLNKAVKANWRNYSPNMGNTAYCSTQDLCMSTTKKTQEQADKLAKDIEDAFQTLDHTDDVKIFVNVFENCNERYTVNITCRGPKKAKRSFLPYYD